MSDILHITSRSETDDTAQLQRYLLEDRGWQLLQVLHTRGAQVGENSQLTTFYFQL